MKTLTIPATIKLQLAKLVKLTPDGEFEKVNYEEDWRFWQLVDYFLKTDDRALDTNTHVFASVRLRDALKDAAELADVDLDDECASLLTELATKPKAGFPILIVKWGNGGQQEPIAMQIVDHIKAIANMKAK